MLDIISEVKRDFIVDLLRSKKRVDNRAFDEYRPIVVEPGISGRAEGSSLVKIGDTQVMVGVKLAIGTPFSDMPDTGVMMTNAELNPLASPRFEKGPPGEDTIELARVVDRVIRESKCIGLEKLCITEGEEVWMVFIDAHILDYDGNLFDATTLGAISALLNTRFPKVEDGRIIYTEKTNEKLPVRDKPIETTFVKIDGDIVLDPILDEELVLDARITIGTNEKGEMCAMQKGGSGTFTQDEIIDLVNKSREKAKDLRKLI